MTKELKTFLNDIRWLIEEENFTEIYRRCPERLRSELQEVLSEVGAQYTRDREDTVPYWRNHTAFMSFIEEVIPYEGRCKYCSLDGDLPTISLTWISQEEMDDDIADDICDRTSEWFTLTTAETVEISATMYCRDTPDDQYIAKFKSGNSARIMRMPSPDEISERAHEYLDAHPYSSSDDPDDICYEIAKNVFDIDYDDLSDEVFLHN